MLGSPPTNTAFWLEHMNTKWSIKWWHHWCHHFMLSGPEVFTPIFLQFLPKTRLAKYHHRQINFTPSTNNLDLLMFRAVLTNWWWQHNNLSHILHIWNLYLVSWFLVHEIYEKTKKKNPKFTKVSKSMFSVMWLNLSGTRKGNYEASRLLCVSSLIPFLTIHQSQRIFCRLHERCSEKPASSWIVLCIYEQRYANLPGYIYLYLPLITSRQYWRWDVMGRKEK